MFATWPWPHLSLFMPVESPSLLPLLTDILPLERRPLWRKVLRHLAGWTLGFIATGLAFTLLVWMGLHWFILPHIDQWRAEIETRTSRAVGVPVRLGGISVQSKGWSPSVELRDVVLFDAQARPALVLPRVLATLSPRSVLALEPRFAQLVIDGAHLEIERDAQGRLSVAGLPLQPDQAQTRPKGLSWLFRQSEIAIRGASVRWTDLQRQAPPLALSDVQLVLRNGLREHAMRLDATPPADWGQRFSLRGRFQQALLADSGDWARWSGTVYSELPQADVSQLKRYMKLPFALEEGQGALRAWIDVEDGRAVAATVDVALRSVAAQLAPEVTPLALQRIQGRLSGERRGNSTRINLSQFGFTTQAGLEWPRGDIALSWQQTPQGAVSAGGMSAQRLDLNLMAQIATHLPVSASLHQALDQARPQGVVQGLGLSWEGPIEAPARYKLKGVINNLAVEALPPPEPTVASPPSSASGVILPALGRPGIRGATLDINATEKGGRAQIQVTQGAFTFPGLWEDPLVPLTQLSAQLQWRIDAVTANAGLPKLTVELTQAQVSNDDVQGDARATWTRLPGPPDQSNPGTLDLTANVRRGRADRVARYLPQHLQVRHYLAGALHGGRLAEGQITVQGDLKDFSVRPRAGSDPTKPPPAAIRITTKVDDLTLAYVPDRPAHDDQPAWTSPWPVLSSVAGEMILERGGLQFRNVRGQYQGVRLSKVQAAIKDLGPGGALVLDGQGSGPLSDLLTFVNASPLGRWAGQAVAQAQGDGPAELTLGLNLPLADARSGTVKGSLTLPGNQLRWSPELPLLSELQGRLDFTQRSLTLTQLRSKLLGGDAQLEGGWQTDTGVQLQILGNISAEGLRQATDWPEVARVAQALGGQTTYRLALGMAHGRPEISLTSSGQGMSSNLPAPLNKVADAAWTLRAQTLVTAPEVDTERASRDTLRLTLGPQLQALYARDLSGASPRVLRGQIVVGEGAARAFVNPAETPGATPSPAAVSAQIAVPYIDLDAWRAFADRPATAVALPLEGVATETVAGQTSYVPTSVSLRADELTVAARKLSKVVAQVTLEDPFWRAKIDADQLNGLLTYQASAARSTAQIVVRLSRLDLPPSDARPAQATVPPPAHQTELLPGLDIVIEDFALRGKKLGRLELDATSTAGSSQAAREWRLSRLVLSTPEARLNASGQWAAADASGKSDTRRVVVDFKLDLSDSGTFLERLGMGRAIRGGKGLMSGQLAWAGSPLSLELGLISGQMNVAIDSGQFLKAEPGAARLLSVLSLQSLPRRLALDFRDVFQEGFAFDGITGDVTLAQGVAITNNLRMRGVQAVVLMEGQADLQRETQDLRVVVVPEINAGTASLAYAVINPALGLGTFLAQLFLRKPLTQASTREFHITGTWADPQVRKVDYQPQSTTVTPEPAASSSEGALR